MTAQKMEVRQGGRLVAFGATWQAMYAACRLLFGTGLMLPPDVRLVDFTAPSGFPAQTATENGE